MSHPPVNGAGMGLGGPLIAYANRLPVTRSGGAWRASAGGLVTALQPALAARRGAWIGWSGEQSGGLEQGLPQLGFDLLPVPLARAEVERYYHGFANSTLWPLLHGFAEHVDIDRYSWHVYRTVNERFAAKGSSLFLAQEQPLHWVHDYQLMLVPGLLRADDPTRRIGFFLHVPFPAPELFARLPWRNQILEGLLGSDVVAFQTEEYRDNFARTCVRVRDDLELDGADLVLADGRTVRTAANPISVDVADFANRAVALRTERHLRELRQQFRGRRVLLGIDRLDYTKGILERLRAIELLLEQRPELRGNVVFVQIAVPSRGDVREYRQLRGQAEELVGRINGRFTDPGDDVPVHYLYRSVTPERLLAYYRLADVCLVTPLRDGMNLVAKEFSIAQDAGGEAGVLVLSEFAGASAQLRSALPCNPFDIVGLAGTIELALELPHDDRRSRIESMAAGIRASDVFWWADRELDAIASARPARPARALQEICPVR